MEPAVPGDGWVASCWWKLWRPCCLKDRDLRTEEENALVTQYDESRSEEETEGFRYALHQTMDLWSRLLARHRRLYHGRQVAAASSARQVAACFADAALESGARDDHSKEHSDAEAAAVLQKLRLSQVVQPPTPHPLTEISLRQKLHHFGMGTLKRALTMGKLLGKLTLAWNMDSD